MKTDKFGKHVVTILLILYIAYLMVAALGSARNYGFIEGCEFTREAMTDAITAWNNESLSGVDDKGR